MDGCPAWKLQFLQIGFLPRTIFVLIQNLPISHKLLFTLVLLSIKYESDFKLVLHQIIIFYFNQTTSKIMINYICILWSSFYKAISTNSNRADFVKYFFMDFAGTNQKYVDSKFHFKWFVRKNFWNLHVICLYCCDDICFWTLPIFGNRKVGDKLWSQL